MTDKRRWRTVRVSVAREHGDDAAAFLAHITGSGVLTEEEDGHWLITAYIIEDDNTARTLAEIEAWAGKTGAGLSHAESVEERDWLEEWKKGFSPLRIGERLVVSPSWERFEAREGDTVITIDPGTAFGTGHHESTAMALALIEGLYRGPRPPARVLDVGCGTGILAIACARLGAESVLALDCDPEAVRKTGENARRNGAAERILATDAPLAAAGSGFDLVCANIIHNTLVEMAGEIAAACAPAARLVLAGILRGWQEENILRIYRKAGFAPAGKRHENEWAALLMRKEAG